jgi:hypothetical protein
MNYDETPEFAKEFKKLAKKYRTLPEDLKTFKKNVVVIDLGKNKNFAILHRDNQFFIVKARLFCRYLKRNTLRMVYVWDKREETIEFIEIYFKGDKENEDRDRIRKYLAN